MFMFLIKKHQCIEISRFYHCFVAYLYTFDSKLYNNKLYTAMYRYMYIADIPL